MRAILVLLLLAATFAGCAGESDDATPTTTRPAPAPPTSPPTPTSVPLLLSFNFVDCQIASWDANVPAETAQSWVSPNATVAHNNGEATLKLTFAACQNLTTPTVTVDPFAIGFLEVPLQAYHNESIEASYLLRILSTPGGPEQVWRQAGYDVVTGNLTGGKQELGLPVGTAAWAFANYTGDARWLQPASTSGPFAYVAEHPIGGVLQWTGTWDVAGDDGPGQFSVPDDDPRSGAADLTGAFRGESFVGTGEYTDMDILWVPPR